MNDVSRNDLAITQRKQHMHLSTFHRQNIGNKKTGISIVTLAVFASCLVQISSAQNSPVGMWDLSILNGRNGSAVVEFKSDFTLEGIEITSPPLNKKSDTQYRSGSETRGDEGSDSGTSTNDTVKYYGGAAVAGWWSYDEKGRLIGFYESISTHIGDESATTNGLSFRGIVRPGQRITLMANSDVGRRTLFRGSPSTPNDISGDHVLVIKSGRSETIEFVNLEMSDLTNVYQVTGCGPGYFLNGYALLTGRGRISLQTLSFDNEHFIAATGRYRASRMRGTLSGGNIGNSSVKVTIFANPYGGACSDLPE